MADGLDIRRPCPPLSLSNADGDMPGGGTLTTTARMDGTAPYQTEVTRIGGGGITASLNEAGEPVFTSTGEDGDVFVASFTVLSTDSSTPRRTVNAYRFTVTHSY